MSEIGSEAKAILRETIPGWQEWTIEDVKFLKQEDNQQIYLPAGMWRFLHDDWVLGVVAGCTEDGRRFVCYHPISREVWDSVDHELIEKIVRDSTAPPGG